MFTYKMSNRKNQYGEWVVRCWRDCERYPDGDYHSDDKEDAVSTMKALQNDAANAIAEFCEYRTYVSTFDGTILVEIMYDYDCWTTIGRMAETSRAGSVVIDAPFFPLCRAIEKAADTLLCETRRKMSAGNA